MIIEFADICIRPGEQAAFDQAITRGIRDVVSKAKGFHSYRVSRSIETPERYALHIRWDTLENHTRDFRESPGFAEWRAIVGPFFASPPVVEHFEVVVASNDA